jgi:putative ABC transport system permease protein
MPDATPHWSTFIRARLRGAALEEDVIDEVSEHVREVYRTSIASGQSHQEAMSAIEEEMKNLPALTRAAAATRRQRTAARLPLPPPAGRRRLLAAFSGDIVYGVRGLASRPGFTAVAVLTLALGIGANAAIFSVINRLYLQPLPFPEPQRLVMTWEYQVEEPDNPFIVSQPNWEDWQRQSTSFEHMAIWELLRFNLAGDAEPEQVSGMRVSHGLFPMLGLAPQLGRTFRPEEDAPGHQVVVISDALWRSRYGARPDIVGQVTRLNRKPYEIIGVMPPEFIFEHRRNHVWVPIAFNATDADRGSHSFRAAARLKRGVSFEIARAEMQAIGSRLAAQHEANSGESATITRMSDLGVAYLKPTLYALLGAVALVLLIACVNVANLLLAQSAARQREFAIRAALGAGRVRIASQLLAEGLILAIAGGAAGLALAWAGAAMLDRALPPSIQFAPYRAAGGAPLDPLVLTFTFAVAALTGILFSLAPIMGLAGSQPALTMRAGGERGGTARFSGLRGLLVGVEVALAVIVLAAAGLMIKSVGRLIAVDPGLDTRNVLLMDMALPQEDFYGPAVRTTFCADLERELSAVPGLVHHGAISHLPLSGASAGRAIVIEGRPAPANRADIPGAAYRVTCPGYFATLGIPLVRGRDFTQADATDAPGVIIINEKMAQDYWPNTDPIGRHIKLGDADSPNPWLTVVGVARDVRHFGLDSDVRREMFRPYPQAAWPQITITVKSGVDPLAVAGPVREALRRIDRDQPVTRVRAMQEVLAESIGSRRFPMLLLSVFSGVALLLAVIGVYGVVSYVVSQRSREIGIRMALGARTAQVVKMVVGRSVRPIGIGLVAGFAGALLASRLLDTLLYEVTPHDPLVLSTIVLLLGGSAVVASFVPARRAATVDPLVVLKEE